MSELAKINACAKRPIDIWTNFIYYPLSIRLVYLVRNTGVTPNALTISSLFIALIGCALFANGTHSDVLWGLLLVQISYVVDCADGQLARYKQKFSPVGGWIDQVADRIKEFAIFATLAYGYTRVHGANDHVWMYALFALFVLYLLEYYGQIRMGKPTTAPAPDARRAAAGATADESSSSADGFARAQRLRAFVPFRGFLIGEQYFALLVFVLFNAIIPYFLFVGILGGLMCIYRPIIQYVKLRRGLT
jgi:archaetidylinositol phosphate synthase